MNNVLDNPLVEFIYDNISKLNECSLPCDFEHVTLLISKATDISDVHHCRRLALDALDILANAGLIVYDNGYKVLPAL